VVDRDLEAAPEAAVDAQDDVVVPLERVRLAVQADPVDLALAAFADQRLDAAARVRLHAAQQLAGTQGAHSVSFVSDAIDSRGRETKA